MVGSTYPSMLHLQLSTFSLISASLEQAKHHVGSTHFRNSSIFWLPTCSRAGYDGYLDGYPEFGLYPEPVPFKC